MEFDGFDWDEGNRGKCQKHGVSIAEIEGLFGTTLLVAPDPSHSQTEERFRAIGKTAAGRPVFIVFTWRTKNRGRFLRPLSARYMHKHEVESHEEELSKLEDR